MREAYIDALCDVARERDNVYLLVGDVGYSVVEKFQEEFPCRFINCGVAEQSMASIAAGLASEGNHVFVYSIANFPVFRCAEQIRNDIDYHHLPVTIVSVGGGVVYGQAGYSHHAIQDYAFMRSMPNTLIAAPANCSETIECVRYLVDNPQPSYLRLGRARGPEAIYVNETPLQPGEWNLVRRGESSRRHIAVLSTGGALPIVLQKYAHDEDADIYTLPLWGAAFKMSQESWIAKYNIISVYEDHLVDGGFASWILESVTKDVTLRARISINALDPGVCGAVGTQNELESIGGFRLGVKN